MSQVIDNIALIDARLAEITALDVQTDADHIEAAQLISTRKSIVGIRAKSTSGLTTMDAIKARMFEYMEYLADDAKPVKLVNINRRYGQVCRPLGIKPFDVVEQLAMSKQVVMFERNNNTIIVTSAGLQKLYDSPLTTLENRRERLESLLALAE